MKISGVTYAARRTHKSRGIIVIIAAILILAVAAVAVVSAYNSWLLLHPEKNLVDSLASNMVPEYREVSFKSTNSKLVLNGWFFKSGTSNKTVIVAHSYGNNRLEFGAPTINLYKELLSQGYNVLAFDLRNSGKSDGSSSALGSLEKEDVLAAVNYVRQQGAKHIKLLGFSTGAVACILAAAEDSSIEAVVADSPYIWLSQYVESYVSTTSLPAIVFNYSILKALDVMAEINDDNSSPYYAIEEFAPCDLLLIYSQGDSPDYISFGQRFFNEYSSISKGKSELWNPASEGHANSYEDLPAEYTQKIIDFFAEP